MSAGVAERAGKIRLMIFDVDGVMTDGRLYYSDSGEEMKAFNARDGQGIKLLQAAGIVTAIITSRRSPLVALRAKNLGISHLQQGVEDKLTAFNELLAACGLSSEQSNFVGDDLVDLPVLRRCGLAIAVADAPDILKQHVHYVTRARGGHGAVREACELVLNAQGAMPGVLEPYLK
jgi:3-deoxy-D-manno-octulosonate 8-phosphate phosphatase (KDO 8-P phosphatase)